VGLGPAHHDAVRLALHHVHEHVRVAWSGRPQAAVPLTSVMAPSTTTFSAWMKRR